MLRDWLVVFSLSGLFTAALVRLLILAANKWELFEAHDHRKRHAQKVPTLGGIAIFLGLFVVCLGYGIFDFFILLPLGFIVVLGAIDDLWDLSPWTKLVAQFLAAFLLLWAISVGSPMAVTGHSFEGLLMFFGGSLLIVFLVNAYNFLDGSDGLLAVLGIFSSFVLMIFFGMYDGTSMFLLGLALAGSLSGFLWFNRFPAKVFMGDSGSMLVGLVLSLMIFQLLRGMEFHLDTSYWVQLPLAIGIVFVPVVDALRVIMVRIREGSSPMRADRAHVHHILLDRGWSPSHVALTLGAGVVVVSVVFCVAWIYSQILFWIFLSMSSCLYVYVFHRLSSKEKV